MIWGKARRKPKSENEGEDRALRREKDRRPELGASRGDFGRTSQPLPALGGAARSCLRAERVVEQAAPTPHFLARRFVQSVALGPEKEKKKSVLKLPTFVKADALTSSFNFLVEEEFPGNVPVEVLAMSLFYLIFMSDKKS